MDINSSKPRDKEIGIYGGMFGYIYIVKTVLEAMEQKESFIPFIKALLRLLNKLKIQIKVNLNLKDVKNSFGEQ